MSVSADGESAGLLLLGLTWVALTLVFEFGFGRLVERKPWPELLYNYNLPAGRIWPLVLLVELVTPAIIG